MNLLNNQKSSTLVGVLAASMTEETGAHFAGHQKLLLTQSEGDP